MQLVDLEDGSGCPSMWPLPVHQNVFVISPDNNLSTVTSHNLQITDYKRLQVHLAPQRGAPVMEPNNLRVLNILQQSADVTGTLIHAHK